MNIIITGASRGIGFELTKEFARNGNHNIVIVSRNAEKLNKLKEECLKLNSNISIKVMVFDLVQIESIPRLAYEINNNLDSVDLLINNAGYLVNRPFAQTSPHDVETIYKVNTLAPFELTRNLLPSLGKSKSAHVVNISSMGGFQGSAKFPGLAAYSSSKAAIASLTECLAEEYNETNMKFNCLALGAVATEMLAEAFPGYEAPTNAAEMAEFIANFALNGHKTFNGKVIPVSQSTP